MGSAHEMSWFVNLVGWHPAQWLRMCAAHGGWDAPRERGRSESRDDLRGGLFRPPFPPGFRPKFSDSRTWLARFWGGPKVRRGGVRAAVLVLLTEGPCNGYQIIQKITERSGGAWRPSAGSVYPTLQQLEDEGFVRTVESGTRRLFELTEKGRTYVETHAGELGDLWEAVAGIVGERGMEMRELLGNLAMATFQVLQAGSEAQADEVRRILVDTRRSLYQILIDEGIDSAARAEEDTQ